MRKEYKFIPIMTIINSILSFFYLTKYTITEYVDLGGNNRQIIDEFGGVVGFFRFQQEGERAMFTTDATSLDIIVFLAFVILFNYYILKRKKIIHYIFFPIFNIIALFYLRINTSLANQATVMSGASNYLVEGSEDFTFWGYLLLILSVVYIYKLYTIYKKNKSYAYNTESDKISADASDKSPEIVIPVEIEKKSGVDLTKKS